MSISLLTGQHFRHLFKQQPSFHPPRLSLAGYDSRLHHHALFGLRDAFRFWVSHQIYAVPSLKCLGFAFHSGQPFTCWSPSCIQSLCLQIPPAGPFQPGDHAWIAWAVPQAGHRDYSLPLHQLPPMGSPQLGFSASSPRGQLSQVNQPGMPDASCMCCESDEASSCGVHLPLSSNPRPSQISPRILLPGFYFWDVQNLWSPSLRWEGHLMTTTQLFATLCLHQSPLQPALMVPYLTRW